MKYKLLAFMCLLMVGRVIGNKISVGVHDKWLGICSAWITDDLNNIVAKADNKICHLCSLINFTMKKGRKYYVHGSVLGKK
ncbi:hypothetical protein Glove_328g32 [Diversispora epigaea]|uniref:Uncharacterized protein n=1 Tax=Diversispora epigaea TaxID=1348612 RepID=A0A397HKS0_9GLOM|nr:hypothetical protein Glove_328g32 [Diversispora epigaea]